MADQYINELTQIGGTLLAAADDLIVWDADAAINKRVSVSEFFKQTQLKFLDGSAAAPVLTFDLESTTGFYRKGASQLGIAIAGAERAYLSATSLMVNGAVSSSAGVTIGNGGGAAILIDGTDGTIASGSNGIYESGGALYYTGRGSHYIDIDNDNNGTGHALYIRHNLGTVLFLFVDDGNMTLGAVAGTGTGTAYIGQLNIGATMVISNARSISNIVDFTASGIVTGGALHVTLAAGNVRDLRFQTAGVNRWILRANGAAESGANAGSDFEMYARDDAGASLGTVLTFTRSTGAAVIGSFGAGTLSFKTANTVRWFVDGNGHLAPNVDNTYDIGSATYSVRSIYADTSMYMGGTAWMNSSRNLSNIGTVGCGAITSTSTGSFQQEVAITNAAGQALQTLRGSTTSLLAFRDDGNVALADIYSAKADKYLIFRTNGSTQALKLDTAQIAWFASSVAIVGTTRLTGIMGQANLQIDKTTNGTVLLHRESADNGGATFELLKRRSAWSLITLSDRLGTIVWSAADGTDAEDAAQMYVEAGYVAAGIVAGTWKLALSNSSGVLTTALTIDYSLTAWFGGGIRVAGSVVIDPAGMGAAWTVYVEDPGVTENLIFERDGTPILTLLETGAASVNGSLTVGGTQLSVNGITYTWPSGQAASAGYTLMNDGSGALSWDHAIDPKKIAYLYEDFFGQNAWAASTNGFLNGNHGFLVGAPAGGSATQLLTVSGHPGILRLVTGASAPGAAYATYAYWKPAEVSTLTVLFRCNANAGQKICIGFADSWANAVNGWSDAIMMYASGTTLTCLTESGGTQTTNTSTITADTWHEFKIERTASSVKFYKDGTLLFTHTTNIPTADTYLTIKNEYASGAGSYTMDLDYVKLIIPALTR